MSLVVTYMSLARTQIQEVVRYYNNKKRLKEDLSNVTQTFLKSIFT